jgi:hypothetical protein
MTRKIETITGARSNVAEHRPRHRPPGAIRAGFAAPSGAPLPPFSLLRRPIVPWRSGPRTRTSG